MATVETWCDGGKNKYGGYGSYLVDVEEEPKRLEYKLDTTNNEAEYLTLIALLNHVREIYQDSIQHQIIIYSDSELMISQLDENPKTHRSYKVKAANLYPYWLHASHLLRETGAILKWVPREKIVKKLGH